MRSAPVILVRLCLALALCLARVLPAGAQSTAASPEREQLLKAAREIMAASRYCAVITVDAAGRPVARAIDAFAPDERMVVWFATNPKTRKVQDLRRDPRVTLYYFDQRSPGLGYVTMYGRARLVDDEAEKQKRWKPEWAKLWPDRHESYLLVEVRPERLEIVSPQHGLNSDPVTWRPIVVELGEQK